VKVTTPRVLVLWAIPVALVFVTYSRSSPDQLSRVRRVVASAKLATERRMLSTVRRGVARGSRFTSALVTFLVESRRGRVRRRVPLALRKVYEMTRPVHPLGGRRDGLPSILVLIPCTAKDLATVRPSLAASRSAVLNPITGLILVSPRRDLENMADLVGDDVSIRADEDVLHPRVISAIDELVPAERRGWVIQQVVKLTVVASASVEGVLVVDSDTVLLEPRVWLAGSRQLLPVVHEFHAPYMVHAKRCLGELGGAEGVSWVSHHQLMQPRVVRRMLTQILCRLGDVDERPADADSVDVGRALELWIRSADFSEHSALSEYHTYGAFLRHTEPSNAIPARWGNVAMTRSSLADLTVLDLDAVRQRGAPALSVSLHAHLTDLPAGTPRRAG
jgi:hypothetical protein